MSSLALAAQRGRSGLADFAVRRILVKANTRNGRAADRAEGEFMYRFSASSAHTFIGEAHQLTDAYISKAQSI